MHKALRPFKYQAEDGTVKMALIGDPLPGAGNWRNVEKLIRRRWITQADGQTWAGLQYRMPMSAKMATSTQEASQKPQVSQAKAEISAWNSGQKTYTEADLGKLLKMDVQTIASTMGLEIEGTKTELATAILEAQGG